MTKVVQALLLNNTDAASGRYPKVTNLAIPAGKQVDIVVPVKILALPARRDSATWFIAASSSGGANTNTGIFQTAKKVTDNPNKFTLVQVGSVKVNGETITNTTQLDFNKWYVMHITQNVNEETHEFHLGSPKGNNGMVSSLWAYEDMQVFVDQPAGTAKAYADSLKSKYPA